LSCCAARDPHRAAQRPENVVLQISVHAIVPFRTRETVATLTPAADAIPADRSCRCEYGQVFWSLEYLTYASFLGNRMNSSNLYRTIDPSHRSQTRLVKCRAKFQGFQKHSSGPSLRITHSPLCRRVVAEIPNSFSVNFLLIPRKSQRHGTKAILGQSTLAPLRHG